MIMNINEVVYYNTMLYIEKSLPLALQAQAYSILPINGLHLQLFPHELVLHAFFA